MIMHIKYPLLKFKIMFKLEKKCLNKKLKYIMRQIRYLLNRNTAFDLYGKITDMKLIISAITSTVNVHSKIR